MELRVEAGMAHVPHHAARGAGPGWDPVPGTRFYKGKPLAPGDQIPSFDAKPSIRARGRIRASLPAAPGDPVRVEHVGATSTPSARYTTTSGSHGASHHLARAD